jgi:hypothetical protein
MGVKVLPLMIPKTHCDLGLRGVLPSTTSTLPEGLLQNTSDSACGCELCERLV